MGSLTLEGGFKEEVSAFINEWTGVAVLCCHEKDEKVVLIFLFLIDKFLSYISLKILMLFNLAFQMKCKHGLLLLSSLNVVLVVI